MDKIMWAYITSVSFIVFDIVIFLISGSLENAKVITNITMWISFGIIINLLWRDAKSRGLSVAHGLWAFLNIIGILIYHLAFAKKNPVKT